MSQTIKLDIPTPIEGASRRLTHLLETGYVPPQMKSDIETLMRGAVAWELLRNKPHGDHR